MELDEIERRVELLERATDEIERLSRAMVAGMNAHYSQPARDGGSDVGQDESQLRRQQRHDEPGTAAT